MNTTLSPEQLSAYQRDGYVVQRAFLSPAEVSELRDAVVNTVAAMGQKKVADPNNDWVEGDGYYDRVFTQRLNLHRFNPVIKSYMLRPALGQMLCQLEGVDGMRVWHDQALIKEPFGNPTAWHLDNPYWSFTSLHSISIWIALADATLANGCMWFVPGSHKLARTENVGIGPNLGDLFKVYPEMAQVDPVPAPMQAGDCSFHNGLTAHGAGANMTRGRRLAMTCAYMPTGSTFNGNPNILPARYLATLKPGDVLANDDWNPVVYAQPATPVTTPE